MNPSALQPPARKNVRLAGLGAAPPMPHGPSHRATRSASPGDLFLLASAVAGRRAVIHVAREDDGVAYAYSDGQMIVLPAAAALSDDAWLHAVSQALLMAAGSLAPAVLRRMVARPAAARHYAWLEVQRAVVLLRDRVPPLYARRLCETGTDAGTSAHDSALRALSEGRSDEIPAFIGTVRPLAVLRSAVSQGGLGTLLNKPGPAVTKPAEAVREFAEDEVAEDSKILRLFSNPFSGRNPISTLLNEILGTGASRAKHEAMAESSGEEMPIGRIEQVWRRGAKAMLEHLQIETRETDPQHESSGSVYPEWDGQAERYRADWVCVDEVAPWRPDGPRDLTSALQAPSLRMRRELSRLPLDFAMHRRQREGAEFDVGALIDHAADLRAGNASGGRAGPRQASVFPPGAWGHTDSPAIYRASRRTRRDLGVVVVMDASGSTEERNQRGESVFEHHASTAFRLTRTLDSLGDKVALYGFQSWGRRLVHMVRLKGHEEAWSSRVAERLTQLDAVGFTRTGAAVRHADRLLRTQIRLPHRLMVLITDGLSYDHDYEGAYAEDDTRQALAEARAQGTACVCICIGGSVEAAKLASVFGASQLLMVDDSAQVDARIRSVCARALAGVSRRRPHTAPTRRVA